MKTPVTAFIGLGSNIGDRRATIDSALASLAAEEGIEVVRVSAVIETPPLVPPVDGGGGVELGGPYLNAVAEIRTTRSARDLLNACLRVETAHGRCRPGRRWASRTLDLDLLLYGDAEIDEPGLRVPHPRMHERDFVLEPLAELAPEAVHPGHGRSIECLRDRRRAGTTPPSTATPAPG